MIPFGRISTKHLWNPKTQREGDRLMNVTVNGQKREVSDGATVLDVLAMFQLGADAVVVQRNEDIVDRERYGETALAEGDTLELVHIVGGG